MTNRLSKLFLLITLVFAHISSNSYQGKEDCRQCVSSLLIVTAVGSLLVLNETCRNPLPQRALLAQCNINPSEFANKTNFEQHQYIYDKCNISDECMDFDIIEKSFLCGERFVEHVTICPIQGISPKNLTSVLEEGFNTMGKKYRFNPSATKSPNQQKYDVLQPIPFNTNLLSRTRATQELQHMQQHTYTNSSNTCAPRQRIQQPKRVRNHRHRN